VNEQHAANLCHNLSPQPGAIIAVRAACCKGKDAGDLPRFPDERDLFGLLTDGAFILAAGGLSSRIMEQKNSTAEIIVVGDTNVDMAAMFAAYPAAGECTRAKSVTLCLGGAAANMAVALARLGRRPALWSRVGRDPWGEGLAAKLAANGVDCRAVQWDEQEMTGLMYIVITPGGERTILAQRGANRAFDPALLPVNDLSRAKALLVSGYALLEEPQRSAALLALNTAGELGLPRLLDPGITGPKAALDDVRALLPAVDVVLPNLLEAQRLTGRHDPSDAFRALTDAGAKLVAVKLGREGCLVGKGQEMAWLPPFPAEVIDTTGAGDAFAAGFTSAWLDGLPASAAGLLGNAMGAFVTAATGAGETTPRPADILPMLRQARTSDMMASFAAQLDLLIRFIEDGRDSGLATGR